MGGGVTLKALSLAAFAGLALGAPMAIAADVDAQQTPTPNYEPKKLTPADLGTSDKITWTEVDADTPGAIEIVTPAGTQYFTYKTTTSIDIPEAPATTWTPTSTTGHIKWTEGNTASSSALASGVVDVNDGSAVKSYVYEYTKPDNYTISSTSQMISSSTSIENKLFDNIIELETAPVFNNDTITTLRSDFINNSSRNYAGAVYNESYSKIETISGDFINNSTNIVGGGAIGNLGTISTINGDFISNYANYGGAIDNNWVSKIDNINGNFIANYAAYAGGAIYNYGCIGQIRGDFIGNSSGYIGKIDCGTMDCGMGCGSMDCGTIDDSNLAPASIVYGGAIYNEGTITKITGDFINNSAIGDYPSSGGAIYNSGTINNICGDFIANYSVYGGAIHNNGTIEILSGDFINNTAEDSGGAIYNRNTIYTITGDFINNSVNSHRRDDIFGGAIYNHGSIGQITGNFINNSTAGSAGGAIYNNGTISGINGNFISNAAIGQYGGLGGAIDNYGTITTINGDFINNTSSIEGGAINNSGGTLDTITGDFIGNSTYGRGGAILNYGNITTLSGDFIANHGGSGGAICTSYSSNIYGIYGDFIANYAVYGGAIFNEGGTINIIKGNFINNSTVEDDGLVNHGGGAIYNYSGAKIGTINGDFINNSATEDHSYGGAIYNCGTISTLTGNFINNSAGDYAAGGAIYNRGTIGEIKNSSFIGNHAGSGGAIYSNGDLNITADNGVSLFSGNWVGPADNKNFKAVYMARNYYYASSKPASDLGLQYNGNINERGETSPVLTLNSQNNGQIIFDDKILGGIGPSAEIYRYNSSSGSQKINGSSKYVYTYQNLDADYNSTASVKYYSETKYSQEIPGVSGKKTVYTYHILDKDNNETGSVKYYSETKSSQLIPGATGAKNVSTYHILDENNNETSSVTCYYDSKNGLRNYHYLDENNNEISSKVTLGGDIFALTDFKLDGISVPQTAINLNGDSTGRIVLNNDVEFKNLHGAQTAVDINLNGTNLYLGRDNVLDYNNLNLNGGLMSMINGAASTASLNALTLKADTNFVADVDLASSAMDRLSAATYGDHGENKLNVIGMNLLSDSKTDVTSILFADQGLKDNVSTTLASAPDSAYQTKVYTPIYQYRVKYDNRDDAGYFVFDRSVPGKDDNTGGNFGGNGNASDAFNPAVLSSAVSSVAGAQATINETFKYTFGHSDAFTQLPYAERTARMNANKYALSTDFNHNLGALCPEHNNMSAWFKPYVTFESMDLRNGPRVNAKTYGSLAGFDTNFRELKRGWHSVGTGYVGYNGSQLSYSGVSTSMNGGLAGYTETFYKKNFWTAITLTAGASVGESHTMYGKEDFTTLMAGVGSKTGYNFEFKEGKYIIQPIMFMSYTFAKTFDYTNAAGVHVKPGAAHSLQLNPSVRFIANTKGGWQPYASVGMVWNVMNENKVVANDVRLPEMGMKPYVEYGVGLQRNWKDKFTAYGQAMLRNGGRNGIALTAGFRWAIGHEGEPVEKVQNSDKTRTVLKQLTPSQRWWAQQKNTTRTTKAAVIKHL